MVSALKPLTQEDLITEVSERSDTKAYKNVPSDKWLNKAEEKYGDMPEYWQLRYLVLDIQAEKTEKWPPPNPDANKALAKAIEVAPDDPVSLWFYATQYEYDISILPEEEAVLRLRKCTEIEPNEAFYHGELAVQLMGLGELDEAMESFRQACECTKNTHIAAFPTGYGRFLRKPPNRKERELAGYFSSALSSDLYKRNFIALKDRYGEALVVFNLSGDLEILNTMHQYACSYGMRDNRSVIQALVARLCLKRLADGVQDSGLWEGDARAEASAERLQAKLEEIREVLRAQPDSPPDRFFDIGSGGMPQRLADKSWLNNYGRMLVEFETQPRQAAEEHNAILREMAKFDYTNPAAFAEEKGESGD
jgi:tetratricopeptide (TPR) repeat protein